MAARGPLESLAEQKDLAKYHIDVGMPRTNSPVPKFKWDPTHPETLQPRKYLSSKIEVSQQSMSMVYFWGPLRSTLAFIIAENTPTKSLQNLAAISKKVTHQGNPKPKPPFYSFGVSQAALRRFA